MLFFVLQKKCRNGWSKRKKNENYKYKNLNCEAIFASRGNRGSKRFNVVSKGDFLGGFSKAKNMSKSIPCQNRPIECAEYKTLVWSNNTKDHYRISNTEILICPNEISQDEIKKILQFLS